MDGELKITNYTSAPQLQQHVHEEHQSNSHRPDTYRALCVCAVNTVLLICALLQYRQCVCSV